MKKVLLSLLICVFVCGCSLGSVDTSKAEEVVSLFLTAYQEKDKTCSKYLLGYSENNQFTFEGVSAVFADQLRYEITDADVDEDVYIVDVKIETVDFQKLFESTYQELNDTYGNDADSEKFQSILDRKLNNKSMDTITGEYQIIVHNTNEQWKIEMDSSLANALSGGMNAYIESLKGGE